MKKILFSCLALIAMAIPLIAQVDHGFNANDVMILVSGVIFKEANIPS